MQTGIVIAIIVTVGLVLIYGTWYIFKKTKSHKTQKKVNEATATIVFRLLKTLNCKYETEDTDSGKRVEFDFQGGSFKIIIDNDNPYVKLLFLHFFDANIEKLDLIRHLCNELNCRLRTSKYVYTINEEGNNIHIHITSSILLLNEIPELEQYFETYLTENFDVKRYFIEQYRDITGQSKELNTDDIEKLRSEKQRELFLLREQEFSHQENNWKWRLNETKTLTLGQLIEKVFDIQGIEISQLKIVTNRLDIVTERDDAFKYDILSAVILDENGNISFATEEAALIVLYKTGFREKENDSKKITINLKAEGLTDMTLYVRVTCYNEPCSINKDTSLNSAQNSATVYTFLTAFDKSSDNQKMIEFEYMWNDAKEKAESGKMSDLSNEQLLIYNCTHPSLGYNLYWGKLYFRDERYYEALLHLENAYYNLQAIFYSINDSRKESFYEICYLVGFCYCELLQYQKAYFFLDIVFNQNTITYTEEYINCLVNSKDFRAIHIIDNLFAHIEQQKKESEDDPHPNLINFTNFLRRRKAYTHIDLGQMDEAEEIFKSMIQEPENSDYALSELAYIQKIKGLKQNE